MEIDTTIYRSPKRKRGQPMSGPTLLTSNLSHGISITDDHLSDRGNYSPSARVTGKFQKLDIECPSEIPTPSIEVVSLDFQPPPTVTPEQSIEDVPPTGGDIDSSSTCDQRFQVPQSAQFTFESPVPKSTPTSPKPGNSALGVVSPPPKRAKSPPPSSVVSDQFWHASEITGWSPDDPDEDNYGVNGVGYAKTASKAWAISQKRKQQIADYRSRETREARQRRHERRLSGRLSQRASPRPASRNGSGELGKDSKNGGDGGRGTEATAGAATDRKGVRFVHFEDG